MKAKWTITIPEVLNRLKKLVAPSSFLTARDQFAIRVAIMRLEGKESELSREIVDPELDDSEVVTKWCLRTDGIIEQRQFLVEELPYFRHLYDTKEEAMEAHRREEEKLKKEAERLFPKEGKSLIKSPEELAKEVMLTMPKLEAHKAGPNSYVLATEPTCYEMFIALEGRVRKLEKDVISLYGRATVVKEKE